VPYPTVKPKYQWGTAAAYDQLEDNQIDLFERATNVWMKITRGDIATSADGATSVREAGSATTSS